MPAAATRTPLRLPGILALCAGLAACAPATIPDGVNDPFEAQNRKVHAFNKSLDRALLKPAASSYGVIPQPVRRGVGNFARNLQLPGIVLNDLLQFEIGAAMTNSVRFAVNSTVGLGGLIDVAGAGGLYTQPNDFGVTLHHFGVGEGVYLELPVLGPSTTRDAVGKAVDLALDPMRLVVPRRYRPWLWGSTILARVDDRNTYGGLVDSVFYESEDSYAQLRELYLQQRRFRLRGGLSEDVYDDPYAE